MDVRLTPPVPGRSVPARIEPRADLVLERWIGEQRDWLREQLLEHGALLFRGFGIADPERFASFLDAAGLPRMDYPRGTSPRTEVGPQIFTSTETRPDVAIPIHTEMSYTSYFPEAVAFCCVTPSASGGATPLADVRRVRDRIGTDVLRPFEQRELTYVQIVPLEPGSVLERTWPAMFGTDDRAEVERQAAAQGIRCSWLDDGALRIENRCPALRPHPLTKEPVWFNQAHVFALRVFEYQGAQGVSEAQGDRDRFRQDRAGNDAEPYQCRYGDGDPIPEAHLDRVRRALDDETTRFDWEPGDVLLIDNFRVAHGRDTFEGERRLLAALVSHAWQPAAR